MIDYLRKYLIIVLLAVWVVLSWCIDVPWKRVKPTDEGPQMHEVLLLTDGMDKARSVAYQAILLDSGYVRKPELMLYFPKDSCRFEAGSVVLAYVELEEGRGYVPHSALLEKRSAATIGFSEGKLRYLSLRARDGLENRLEQYLSPNIGLHRPEEADMDDGLRCPDEAESNESLALIESLLLGDRRRLNPDQRDAFADAGAMHVLAVSGLHVGIILAILTFLFTLGGRLVIPWEYYTLRRLHRAVILIFIWGYAFLTGMSVSVMRSALMFSFLPLGKLHKESKLKYNRLAAAALIILVLDPAAISSPSFLLSFSAVLAIMYYFPRWRQLLPYREGKTPWRRRWLRFSSYCRDLVLVSVAAQIGTLPFTLFFFGQSANYFLLTNIIILPLAEYALMPLGIAALASSFLPLHWLTSALMRLTSLSAELMNSGVRLVQQLPGATTFMSVTPIMTAFMILMIIGITASFRTKGWEKWVLLGFSAICVFLILTNYWITVR